MRNVPAASGQVPAVDPVADDDGRGAGSRPRRTHRALARPVFIVVDDEPTLVCAIARAVRAYGEVHTAASAASARTLIASLDFALALIDISLPEHDPYVPANEEERQVVDAIRSRRTYDPLKPLGIDLARAARAKAPSSIAI